MIEILTAILVIFTGFYAWATFRILKANEKVVEQMRYQQEATQRPYISISPVLYPENPIVFLKIKNSGLTAAHNVRLSLDRDFYQFGEKREESNLKSFRAFTEPIDSFVPGGEMLFYLAQSFVIFGEKTDPSLTPSCFTITAEYEYHSKKVREKTIIDLRPYLASTFPYDPLVNQMIKLIETIKKK
ncbi:MAG: hypothetical protein FJ110_01680 [Deltaproteobacteria bacterium]|nr:hypothetical protein [Deltaproteobacteria bacterium]